MNRAPDLPDALLDPAVYGIDEPVELRETHISWVFLAGPRAYKLKKPVLLPFLDYTSPARRHELCREEVRLNRRLAPSVYLGVRSVLRDGATVRLGEDGDPAAEDHVVEMRRFDEGRTLAAVLEAGGDPRLGELGRVLAAFHAGAAPLDRPDPVPGWTHTVTENAETLCTLLPDAAARIRELERFFHAFLDGRGPVLAERAAAGLVRDGHGDLRADHVLLEPAISIVDCLEFDPGLRITDVGADLATLVTDLRAREHPHAADEVTAAYRAAGGDPGAPELQAFWVAHRALVSATVVLLRKHPGAGLRAGRLLGLAERASWGARGPLVLAVCGPAASGKSTLAAELARRSGFPVVASDVVRRELAGVSPGERAPLEAYGEQARADVYAELGRRAREAVGRSGGVIVDATGHRARMRRCLEAELGDAGPPVYLWCRAPAAVLRERAERRLADPLRLSDATPEIAERQLGMAEPFDPRAVVVDVPADTSVTAAASAASAGLDLHLAGAAARSGGVG